MIYVVVTALVVAVCGTVSLMLMGWGIIRAWEKEREEWNRERAVLIQRVVAPEVAAADHSDAQHEPSEQAPWLGWDEDPETLTKEELAELE